MGIDDAGAPWSRVGPAEMAGWLLSCHRLYSAERLLTTQELADALARPVEPPVHKSTVTRWEKSRTTVPERVLRRYEQLFDLPCGELTAVMSALGRVRPPGRRSSRPRHELLDKCLGGEVMVAADWSDLIGGMPPFRRLLPQTHWYDLARRLLTEMSVSIGWRYLRRLSALQQLHRHDHGGPALIAAISDFVTQPGCQLIIDPVALLAASPRLSASQHLLEFLRSPRNESEQLGALIAWASSPHKSRELSAVLENLATTVLTDRTSTPRLRRAAGDLLATLPGARVRRREGPPRSRIARPGQAGEAILDTLTDTVSGVQVRRHEDDVVTARLIRQAVFSTDSDLQVLTVNVLCASPFRDVIADSIGRLLRSGRIGSDPAIQVALISLLGSLGRSRHRGILERLLVPDPVPTALAGAIAFALAHLPGRTDLRLWCRLLDSRASTENSSDSTSVHRAVLYAIGMNNDRRGLLHLHHGFPDVGRRAHWWLHLPAVAVTSARL